MDAMISIPRRSLVVLIGLPGCGKTTFARKHFFESSIVSSDLCRRLVSDDERNQVASRQAFVVMEAIVAGRMELGRLVVVDAMNARPAHRRRWLDLARRYEYPAQAIVLDVPPAVCISRDASRERHVGAGVILEGIRRMRIHASDLAAEGFDEVWRLGMDVIDRVTVDVIAKDQV